MANNADLPLGWEQCMSKSASRPYYANRTLRVTQWERPSASHEASSFGGYDNTLLQTVGDAAPGSKEFQMVLDAVGDDMSKTHTRWKRSVRKEIDQREVKDAARRNYVPQHQKQLVESFPNYPYNNFPYKPRGGKWGRSEWPIPGMQGGFMLYRRPPFGESPALCAPYETTQAQWYEGFNPKREFVYRARSYKALNDVYSSS